MSVLAVSWPTLTAVSWPTLTAVSWPTLTAPAMAWALLLLPLVVLLWFLKLRRPRLDVSSLVLWQRVIEDQRVNSPLRRLKRNLLLLLQLLAVLLLAFALMQPEDKRPPGNRILLLLDRSASMTAVDGQGRTSMARAKEAAAGRIEALGSGQQMGLVVFDQRASLAVPYTESAQQLLGALEKVTPAAVGSDLREALDLAQGLARTEGVDRAVLISDGNLPQPDLDAAGMPAALPFPVDYQQIKAPTGNVGITALRARRGLAVADQDAGWRVFVEARGDVLGTWELTVQAMDDGMQTGEEISRVEVVPDGQGIARVALEIPADVLDGGDGVLRFTLKADASGPAAGEDALALDDQAWLTLTPPRPLRVALGAGLPEVTRALAAFHSIEVEPIQVQADPSVDLAIAAATEPLGQAPLGLVFGEIPPDLSDVLERRQGLDVPVDWARTAPLLEHVELADLDIRGQVAFREPELSAGVEPFDPQDVLAERGYRTLVDGGAGPLVLRRDDPNLAGPRWHVLFAPGDSTLPFRLGFPILITNALTQAQDAAGLLEVQGTATGVLEAPGLPEGVELQVIAPSGVSRRVTSLADGRLPGIAAQETGVWRVQDPAGGEVASIGASLLDARETDLLSRDRIAFRAAAIEAGAAPRTGRPWWYGLALLALLLVVVEWWWFARRPGSPARRPGPPPRRPSTPRSAVSA